MSLQCQLGDIVLVGSDGLIGYLIRRQEQRRGEGRSYVNHACVVVGFADQEGRIPLIIDAQPMVIRIRPLVTYAGELAAIYRLSHLTEGQRASIALAGRRYDGHWYGVLKILLIKLGLKHVLHYVGLDVFPICSWIVAKLYFQYADNWLFAATAEETDPDDIYDDCAGSSAHRYECIKELGILTAKELA